MTRIPSDSKREEYFGAHLDTTTLIAVADILGLVESTRTLPPTLDLILTLAQFIESLVIQEHLYYGECYRSAWEPYGDLISDSGLEELLGGYLLIRHQSPLDSQDMELDAIRWANSHLRDTDLRSIRFMVAGRESCYRAIDIAKGIKDQSNPVQEIYLSLPETAGDETLHDHTREAIEGTKGQQRSALFVV